MENRTTATPPQAGGDAATPTVESLQNRIRQRMMAKGLKQSDLAERAKLAPAVLSRIMSADRDVKLEHVAKIAHGLEESLATLLLGTDMAELLSASIPLEVFDSETQRRLDAQADARTARADALARAAERDSLRASLDAEAVKVAQLRQELAVARAEVNAAREQERNLRDMKRELQNTKADAAATRARLADAEQQRLAETARADQNYQAWAQANARAQALAQELEAAGEKMVVAGTIGTLLGGIVGRATAPSVRTPTPRRPAPTKRKKPRVLPRGR